MSLSSCRLLLLASLSTAQLVRVSSTPLTTYSTNAICRQRNCINPVFPGFTDLKLLESAGWQCQDAGAVRSYLSFCANAIQYDPAVMSPTQTSGPKDLKALVNAQENAAATAYFYHLNGMNLDAWDYQTPWTSDNPCVSAVWKMSCMTYFPKQAPGCLNGQGTNYLRPCGNVCQQYVDKCQVECCDESAKCVFDHVVQAQSGTQMLVQGYVNAIGPDATCTGWASGDATRRSDVHSSAWIFVMAVTCLVSLGVGVSAA